MLSIGQTIGAARANANNRNGLASNRDDEQDCFVASVGQHRRSYGVAGGQGYAELPTTNPPEDRTMRADHTDAPAGCDYATVYFAFELSKSKGQLGGTTPGGGK